MPDLPSEKSPEDWLAESIAADLAAAEARARKDALRDACEPWSFHVGPPPAYDSPLSSVFGAGLQHGIELFAKLLGVENFEPGDGSEDFDQDVTTTFFNILIASGLWNEDFEPQAKARARAGYRQGAALADAVEHDIAIARAEERERCAAWVEMQGWIKAAACIRALAPRPEQADAADGTRPLRIPRDELGRIVREAWVRWARTQPDPKPSWLVPYDDLSEADKEADRQIGEAVARWTIIADACWNGTADLRPEQADATTEDAEEAGRKAYTAYTDNHPTLHSNRFPGWDELTENDRRQWRPRTKRTDATTEDHWRRVLAETECGECDRTKRILARIDATTEGGGNAS